MTFLAYLATKTDWGTVCLRESLSGLADGVNDIAAVVAHLRATLDDFEQAIALAEAEWHWREWKGLPHIE